MENKNILEVKNLEVDVLTPSGIIKPVRRVNFSLEKNQILGIIGESGSGKSMTIKSIMRLHNERKMDIQGSILFEDKEILSCTKSEMRELRGKDIAMIFQDPMVSFNPIKKIGKQLMEVVLEKERVSKAEAKSRVLKAFEDVDITPAEQRFNQYPFELSGGMLQRMVIAMSMLCDAKLLLADEPTTALDVTTQGQILELIRNINKERGMSVVVVTHNFGVVAEICDTVAVMYAGEIVETGEVVEIFDNPLHPYTKALMESRPNAENRKQKLATIPGVPPKTKGDRIGCPFAPRCKEAKENCFGMIINQTDIKPGRMVRCCKYGDK